MSKALTLMQQARKQLSTDLRAETSDVKRERLADAYLHVDTAILALIGTTDIEPIRPFTYGPSGRTVR